MCKNEFLLAGLMCQPNQFPQQIISTCRSGRHLTTPEESIKKKWEYGKINFLGLTNLQILIWRCYCQLCSDTLAPRLTNITLHNASSKHQVKVNKNQTKLTFTSNPKGEDNPTKEAEVKLATFVFMHCSIKTMDHLGELVICSWSQRLFG